MNLSNTSTLLSVLLAIAAVATSAMTVLPEAEATHGILMIVLLASSLSFALLAAVLYAMLRDSRLYREGWPVRIYAVFAVVVGFAVLLVAGG